MSAHPARLLGPVLGLLLLLTACTGSDADDRAPEEVLAEARTQLDETPGVELSLTTEQLPRGVEGIIDASGVGTHAPAFEGDITVRVNELDLDVPVVAVSGKVYAKLPFTTEFTEIDPADYGAPNPADLMDSESGVSSWLTSATSVERGDQVREGERVLTPYTATLPGTSVAEVIPSAREGADFDVTFLIDEEDRLDTVRITGPFYGDSGEVDYTLAISGYGTDPQITPPTDVSASP